MPCVTGSPRRPVAVLDLRVIGHLFPQIRALAFWPQFADHLAFGALLGGVLADRRGRRSDTSSA